MLIVDAVPGLKLLGAATQARLLRSVSQVSDLVTTGSLHRFSVEAVRVGFETWRQHPLTATVPTSVHLAGAKLPPYLSSRTANALKREYGETTTWVTHPFEMCPDDWLTWRGFGVTSAKDLLVAIIEESLCLALKPVGPAEVAGRETQPGDVSEVVSDLELIMRWASAEQNAQSIVEALNEAQSADAPEEVRGAVDHLNTTLLKRLHSQLADPYDVVASLDRIWLELTEREQVVAQLRVIEPSKREKPTLEDLSAHPSLAVPRKVTRERVRQLETKAIFGLRTATARRENAPAQRLANALRQQLGVVAPLHAITHDLTAFPMWRRIRASSRPELLGRLALWIAGPYEAHGEWLTLASRAGDIRRKTEETLIARIESEGPLEESTAVSLLEAYGIRGDYAPDWIGELRVHRVNDLVVPWNGSLSDKAYWILRALDEPLEASQISVLIPKEHNPNSLFNQLSADPRFTRTDRHTFALAEWGASEYRGVVQAVIQCLQERGGVADVEDLVADVTSRFTVSENSVRTYAGGHWFTRLGDGRIRLRRGDDPLADPPSIESVPGCFHLLDGWAVRITITEDTLRGSGLAIRSGLAGHLRLKPGQSVVMTSSDGHQLTASWNGSQPALGSQREIVLLLEGRLGDYLFIEFTGRNHDTFVPHIHSEVDGDLLNEIGMPPGMFDSPVKAAAFALGLDPEMSSSRDVRARFVARGERYLADLLPEDTSSVDILGLLGL